MRHAHWSLVPLCLILVLISLPGGAALAEENVPETVVVKLGPLGESIDAKGTVVPARVERCKCELEAYRGKLEIAEAAPEGPVVKGQTLIRFDDADYREELTARERGFALARIKLEQTEIDARLRKAENAHSMDEAVRSKRLADEALERFEKVERKLKEEGKLYSFDGRRISIQNMREELAQLENMYKEDDLTEETEEIVLKRNRRGFERMLESFERAKIRHAYDMKVSLPREHETLRSRARKATNSLERLKATRPLDDRRRALELDKAREDFKKAEEKLGEFREDADALTVKAPIAGTAVRGSFSGGKWSGLGNDEAYEVGEKSKAGQVLYTVVDESTLRVNTSVKETDLADIKPGQMGTVTTGVTGKKKFEAEVAKVARYGSGGSYEVVLRLKGSDPGLRAGLGCKVSIPKAAGEDVLSIPAGCTLSEDKATYVWVVGEEEGGTKTKIELGRKSGGRVVVKSGLKAGQRLLAKPPAKK